MSVQGDSLSVLIVDEDPAILVFLGRLLGSNDIRALFARDSREAIGIAERDYVPIDLVLTNVRVPDAPELQDRLGEIRPGMPLHYMSARLDGGVIQVDWMISGNEAFAVMEEGSSESRNLIKSIRAAATTPLVRVRKASNS